MPGHVDLGSVMPSISPSQIRAARGMLDWSMMDLAKAAQVSISTVKRFEVEGTQSVSDQTAALMREALESAGIRFLADEGEGPGLRHRRRRG